MTLITAAPSAETVETGPSAEAVALAARTCEHTIDDAASNYTPALGDADWRVLPDPELHALASAVIEVRDQQAFLSWAVFISGDEYAAVPEWRWAVGAGVSAVLCGHVGEFPVLLWWGTSENREAVSLGADKTVSEILARPWPELDATGAPGFLTEVLPEVTLPEEMAVFDPGPSDEYTALCERAAEWDAKRLAHALAHVPQHASESDEAPEEIATHAPEHARMELIIEALPVTASALPASPWTGEWELPPGESTGAFYMESDFADPNESDGEVALTKPDGTLVELSSSDADTTTLPATVDDEV